MHASIGNARNRCRKYGIADPVPADLDYSTLLPIYRRYVRRRAAGERVHVHHKVSVLLGGLHVPSNLSVVTAATHARLSRTERAMIDALSSYRRKLTKRSK
jgi:hypothetical protein